MQLVAAIDEAGTHGDADFMMMGGYAARLTQWARFDHRWKKGLRQTNLPYFHVVEHTGHDFGLKAVQIADRSLMFGFVVRLGREDYQRFYRDGGWGGKAQPDSMYGLCFRYCLSLVVDIALQEMKSDNLIINFVVEGGHPNSGSAPEIVNALKRKRISGISEYLGTAIIGEKTKIPGLQAADMIASGAWKLEQESVPDLGVLMSKPSLKEWDGGAANMKVPILRCHIDQQHLSTFKEDYFAHIEFRRNWGKQRKAETDARNILKTQSSEETE